VTAKTEPGQGWASWLSCATTADGHVVLGYHDARESWTLVVGRERNRMEQLLVSRHELKHQELHEESPWGFLMTMHELGTGDARVVAELARRCRNVHEVFATYNSVGLDADFLDLLRSSDTYRRYYHRAERLADAQQGRSARFADAVLRLCLAARPLLDISGEQLLRLTPAELSDAWSPDVRLRRIERLLSSDVAPDPSWLAELEDLPLEMQGLVDYRDHVAHWLGAHGLESMTTAEHEAWIRRALADVDGREEVAAVRFEVVAGGPPRAGAELADMSRERLQLHDHRLLLEIVSPDDLRERARDFARGHETLGIHSFMVWLRRDLLERQFEIAPNTLVQPAGRPVLGLLACDRVHGMPVARLCPFDSAPALVFAAIKPSSKILFLTTLATIIDTGAEDDLRGITPVFVMVDQPLLDFCLHTIEGGAILRWRSILVEGDRDLTLFVMENSAIPDVLYLHFCSTLGRHHFLSWLRASNGTMVEHDDELAGSHEHALAALVEHVIGTFWRVDQFGGRPSSHGDSRPQARGPAG
jgi:hypothetical protein